MPAGLTFEPITTYTVPSNTNTVTFNSISQSYTHLYIMCNILSAAPGAGLDYYLRLNNITSGYNATRFGATTGAKSTARQNNDVCFQMFYVQAGSSPSQWTAGKIWIPYYTDTTYQRTVQIQGGSNNELGKMSGFINSTAACSVISISNDPGFSGATQIGTGSIFTIYGITKA